MSALPIEKNETPIVHNHRSLNIGDLLKKTRLEKGYRLAQVVKFLNIKEDYIKSLEEENPKDFPKVSIYTIGFLRAYVQLLGLNAEEIVPLFKEKHNIQLVKYIPLKSSEEEIEHVGESDENAPQTSLPFSMKWSLIGLGGFIGIFYVKDFVSAQVFFDTAKILFLSLLE
jgi:cytoskeletal protein RodZ